MRLDRLGEFKVVSLRECPPDLWTYVIDTPDRAAQYWHQFIETEPRYNPEVEYFVCLVLNTRRRCLGHYLVATGTKDTLLVHPCEVFRGAVIANAAALV